MADEPQYIDDDHAAIVGFAESYLEEDERDEFIDGLMERRGYQRVSSWAAPEPDPGQQQGSGGGRKPLVRPRQQQQPAGRSGRSAYFRK